MHCDIHKLNLKPAKPTNVATTNTAVSFQRVKLPSHPFFWEFIPESREAIGQSLYYQLDTPDILIVIPQPDGGVNINTCIIVGIQNKAGDPLIISPKSISLVAVNKSVPEGLVEKDDLLEEEKEYASLNCTIEPGAKKFLRLVFSTPIKKRAILEIHLDWWTKSQTIQMELSH